MTAMRKAEMRRLLRSMYPGRDERNGQSALLCRHILASEAYQRAKVIGGYLPLPHEADITPVLEDAIRCGKTLALPLCEAAPVMTMRRIECLHDLVPGAYGIPEPPQNAPVIPVQKIDLLLVPLEGVDSEGYRLGKGGGYYDRLLQDVNVISLGCALSWQWVDYVPRDEWDKPLTACADHEGIHLFSHHLLLKGCL